MSMDLTRWAYSVQDEAVNSTAKAVLVNICFHANHESGNCELKFSTIMGECGLSKSAVTKAVKRLDDAGYLNRERLSYYDSKLRCYSFTVNREIVPRTTSTERVEVVPEAIRGRTSSYSRSYQVRHKNPKDEPKAEPTTNVPRSSLVGGDSISTSTTGVAAVEVKEELSDNNTSQGTDHEQDPRSLVAKLETRRPRDEAELNGGSKEGGARAAPDLPAELASLLAPLSAGEATHTKRVWERSGCSMPTTFEYRRLRTGKGLPRVYRHSEAVAKLFPEAVPA